MHPTFTFSRPVSKKSIIIFNCYKHTKLFPTRLCPFAAGSKLSEIDLGSDHTDPFGLTGATKTSNSCEGFHSGFHPGLCEEDILLCKALVRASVISVFM